MIRTDVGSLYAAAPDQFIKMRKGMIEDLLDTPLVHTKRWQQLDISESDAHATHELLNVTFWYDMPETYRDAWQFIPADLPWAEGHFQERVAGQPDNPGYWHDKWPYHAGAVDLHQHGGKYDHNYMERMWASKLRSEIAQYGDEGFPFGRPFFGYRFEVGDLEDVVEQLRKDPTTRQAYLPIWFPEDTGATAGQRVPCSLGYHFIIREGKLHLQYNIRSCEVYRHFTNDVYMAVRLAQVMIHWLWLGDVHCVPGQLTMHVVSLHAFAGDVATIEEKFL